MSDRQYFQPPPDIPAILAKGKLSEFILGQGEFSPFTPYPEEDYHRWNAVINYYDGLDNSSQTKEEIKGIILNLYDSRDYKAKIASITLSDKLKLENISTKIASSLITGEFDSFAKWLQKAIIGTISDLEIDDLALQAAKFWIDNNLLEEYIAYWHNPPIREEITFNRNDFWRISSISKYYNISTEDQRKKISFQLVEISKKQEKFIELIKQFFDENNSLGEFVDVIQIILNRSNE